MTFGQINAHNLPFDRGLLLYRQKRYSMAADQFREAIAQSPNHARAQAMLALSLLYDGKLPAARAAIAEALRIDPNLAFCHYAKSYIDAPPPPPMWLFMLRGGRFSRRRLNLRARVALIRAVELEPRNPDYLGQLGAIEYDLRHWDASLAAAERGLEEQPTHRGCMNIRARALEALGHSVEARATADRAIQNDPEHATAHTTRGWLLLREVKPKAAREHFKEALRLSPNDVRALRGLKATDTMLRPVRGTIYRVFCWLAAGYPRRLWQAIVVAFVVASMVSAFVTQDSNVTLLIEALPLVLFRPTRFLWNRLRQARRRAREPGIEAIA